MSGDEDLESDDDVPYPLVVHLNAPPPQEDEALIRSCPYPLLIVPSSSSSSSASTSVLIPLYLACFDISRARDPHMNNVVRLALGSLQSSTQSSARLYSRYTQGRPDQASLRSVPAIGCEAQRRSAKRDDPLHLRRSAHVAPHRHIRERKSGIKPWAGLQFTEKNFRGNGDMTLDHAGNFVFEPKRKWPRQLIDYDLPIPIPNGSSVVTWSGDAHPTYFEKAQTFSFNPRKRGFFMLASRAVSRCVCTVGESRRISRFSTDATSHVSDKNKHTAPPVGHSRDLRGLPLLSLHH